MRMSADKQLRTFCPDQVSDFGFVPARISADVCHQHIDFLAEKALCFGKHAANNMVVDIAINGCQGFEGRKPVGSFGVADVAGVPYFVNRFKKFEDSGAQRSVCI